MDSASFQFIVFGLATALLVNLNRSSTWRSIVLFVANMVFLGLLAQDPIVFLPLAGFLLLGYAGLVMIRRGVSKAVVWSVLGIIFVYIWLKKYTFLPEGIFLHFPYFTLGLSYIFFRVLHLLIEAGKGEEARRIGLGPYLLYTLNFTTLVSGPIQRFDEFARDQFASQPVPLGTRVIGRQLERIVLGFFKVNVLATLLHGVQESAMAQMFRPLPIALKLLAAFLLAVIYPFFLYANFSGYIDIVISLARLMRVRLPENFDRPFSASSFLDFWNRWHITLSKWLRNYTYNPMYFLLFFSMRRITSVNLQPLLGVLCFFVTFFLVGIWHGRTSEFIFFGVLQGAGVSINKLWQLWLAHAIGLKAYGALAKDPVYVSFGRGLTFSWFALTTFWFWSNWTQIDKIFAALSVVQWLVVWLAVWLCATAVLALWEWLRATLLSIKIAGGPVLTSRYLRVVYGSALVVAAFVISVVLGQPPPGVVYKAF
jgi:D-alanyl-lipoteichoic acid acyltransferase DltB (MBOAT superfamily)